MPKFSVDVKALIAFEVYAANENDARIAADAFVENCLAATPDTVEGYNKGLPEDTVGEIVPAEIAPSVDGDSDVEAIAYGDDDDGYPERCSNPNGHEWSNPESEADRCYCIWCGADGDA